MPTVCEEVARLTRDIRAMLREHTRTHYNQTAAIDSGKVTDIKTSTGEYRRTPKGKAVIYTTITDNLEPDSRDVEEIIEHKRPFICRAVRMFAKDEVACYSPSDAFFKFAKASIESIDISEHELKEAIRRKWGDTPWEKWSDAEKALLKAIQSRRRELHKILDGEPAEMGKDPYTKEMIVMSRGRPGLASKVLNKCAFTLK